MLVIMGDLVGVPVGTLFTGAILPGLLMSALYVVFIARWPASGQAAPGAAPDAAAHRRRRATHAAGGDAASCRPALLIMLVLGSIFGGWATPTEASGVGALGAILLAIGNRRFSMAVAARGDDLRRR